jgi:hypothetical protein
VGIFQNYPLQTWLSKQPIKDFPVHGIITSNPLKCTRSKQYLNWERSHHGLKQTLNGPGDRRNPLMLTFFYFSIHSKISDLTFSRYGYVCIYIKQRGFATTGGSYACMYYPWIVGAYYSYRMRCREHDHVGDNG